MSSTWNKIQTTMINELSDIVEIFGMRKQVDSSLS